jgi:hypothetical protein
MYVPVMLPRFAIDGTVVGFRPSCEEMLAKYGTPAGAVCRPRDLAGRGHSAATYSHPHAPAGFAPGSWEPLSRR